jgi:predicted phosphodiesterase
MKNKIYLTGDTHGSFNRFSSNQFIDGKNLTKDDYVIILGDFGGFWNYVLSKEEEYWLNWLNEKNWTTLFIDGNHENFNVINNFKNKEMFNGNVGVFNDNYSIYHLKRGEIYQINGKSFFVMGGAESIDKNYRIEDISWWREELPSYDDYKNGIKNLEKVNNKVDYILTHSYLIDEINFANFYKLEKEKSLQDFYKYLKENVEYEKWYFGHFHDNMIIDNKTNMLYEDIVRIV